MWQSPSFTDTFIWKLCISKWMRFHFLHTLYTRGWIPDSRSSAASHHYVCSCSCSVRAVVCAKWAKKSERCTVGVQPCSSALSHSDDSSTEQRIVVGKQTRKCDWLKQAARIRYVHYVTCFCWCCFLASGLLLQLWTVFQVRGVLTILYFHD